MSTSGTTGIPKRAARTHRAAIEEAVAIEGDCQSKPYEVRRLYCTPIFHSVSAPQTLFTALEFGFPTYLMQRYGSTFAHKVEKFSITETAAPPAMLLKLQ